MAPNIGTNQVQEFRFGVIVATINLMVSKAKIANQYWHKQYNIHTKSAMGEMIFRGIGFYPKPLKELLYLTQ